MQLVGNLVWTHWHYFRAEHQATKTGTRQMWDMRNSKMNQNSLQQRHDIMTQITKFAALRPCIRKPYNNITIKKPPPRASQNIRLRRNPMHCRHITAMQFHLSDWPSRVKGSIKYKHSNYRDLSVRHARRQGYAAG
jgi:hypothetical protein